MNDLTEAFDLTKGVISKAAEVTAQEISTTELVKINKYTLTPVAAGEVFIFKLVAGDNEIDDRNYEPFNLQALKDLARLYPGKTFIKDHSRRADNQIARIYDACIEYVDGKVTGANESLARLVLKCYMVRTNQNKDLITEIEAGIKKEVSTSYSPKKMICSICGIDNRKAYCQHYWGKEYEVSDGKKRVCYFTIDGVKEAYEVSFVAVPAQPRAGTTKNYVVETEKDVGAEKSDEAVNERERILALRVRL